MHVGPKDMHYQTALQWNVFNLGLQHSATAKDGICGNHSVFVCSYVIWFLAVDFNCSLPLGAVTAAVVLSWVRNCFGNSFFFFSGIFFFWLGVILGLSRLLFGKTQGWKAGSCGFFRTFGGGFRAVQAAFWGNQWWNAGSIQVWTQKTASKSKLSCSFLFSVCIYLCWCVCVCLW